MSSHTETPTSPWWQTMVCYQIYVRSFADGDGDGVGDLPGICQRLPHVRTLGADAIWLTPFYSSPQHDHGYDVRDYRNVDSLFGDLADFKVLLREAHALGLRVIIDIVPNHTSNEHEWFRNAVSNPDHPDRELYIFRESATDGGPPNNWGSVFGGPAWSPDPAGTGQWYLHSFAPEQPDLNWDHPRVRDEMEDVLRFWLNLGVDGFRIDVAHRLVKDPDLTDNPECPDADRTLNKFERLRHVNDLDQEGVHDIYRSWRKLVDSYPGERTLVGEVFLWEPERVARYVRPDELHLAFNFLLLGQRWDRGSFHDAIGTTLDALSDVRATPTWVLSNHDVAREVTRFGDGEQGRRRATAALAIILALPGAVFIYQGAELGLAEVDVPPKLRQDPVERHPKMKGAGRDGRRIPIPWTIAGGPGFGFTSGEPWLPTPENWGEDSVEAQLVDPGSVLSCYRRALASRRDADILRTGDFEWLDPAPSCLAFRRVDPHRSLVCVTNMADHATSIEIPGRIALSTSRDVQADGRTLVVPQDTTVWIAT